MKKIFTLSVIISLILSVEYGYGQTPVTSVPQIGFSNKPQIPSLPSNYSSSSNLFNRDFNQKAQQEVIMKEVHQHQLQLQEAANNIHHSHIQNEIQRQTDAMMLTQYGFPSQSDYPGTDSFYAAFDEISYMLSGQQPLNLGRAVFLVENAWHKNKYNYAEYKDRIQTAALFCNQKMEEENLDKEDNLVKNMMLFRFITDTLNLKDKKTGKTFIHYPVKYNYEDYESKISYDSHFVTTLMHTGVGQCHSIPLYYLILAEEIEAEAYWSFSPRHSLVKIQDEKGYWYNLELTCKAILSDTHYMNSSYIKAEALQNKIYLEPLDKTNIVAEMILDLAKGYYDKYGLDDFYLKCINTAECYLKNNLNAKLLRSMYQTRLTLLIAHLLNAPNPEILQKIFPEAYNHFELMQAQYKEIDDMGYEELPVSIYGLWLEHIAKEKQKSENSKIPSAPILIPQKKD